MCSASQSLRALYTLRCQEGRSVFVRSIAGIAIYRIELTRSGDPKACEPEFLKETLRIIEKELAVAMRLEREGA